MTQPKTLLQMAGADTTPNALSESALVLIDCQMEYVTGAVPLGGVEDALAEAGRIRPLLDGEPYALEDVAAAHTRLESGQAVGKVVVQITA